MSENCTSDTQADQSLVIQRQCAWDACHGHGHRYRTGTAWLSGGILPLCDLSCGSNGTLLVESGISPGRAYLHSDGTLSLSAPPVRISLEVDVRGPDELQASRTCPRQGPSSPSQLLRRTTGVLLPCRMTNHPQRVDVVAIFRWQCHRLSDLVSSRSVSLRCQSYSVPPVASAGRCTRRQSRVDGKLEC